MFTRSYERVDCKRELVPAFTSSQCINNKLPSHMFTRSYERVDCKRELVPAFTSSHSISNKFPAHLFTPFSWVPRFQRRRGLLLVSNALFFCSHVLKFPSSSLSLRPSGWLHHEGFCALRCLSSLFSFSLACLCFCLGVRIVFWDRVLLQHFGDLLFFFSFSSGCGCLAWVRWNEGGSLGFLRLRCFFSSSVCAFVCVFLCSFFRSGLLRAFWVWLVCFLGVDVLAWVKAKWGRFFRVFFLVEEIRHGDGGSHSGSDGAEKNHQRLGESECELLLLLLLVSPAAAAIIALGCFQWNICLGKRGFVCKVRWIVSPHLRAFLQGDDDRRRGAHSGVYYWSWNWECDWK